MRVTRLSGSEGGGILCDSPYPYSDYFSVILTIILFCSPPSFSI